jgi:hypothetical protein
VGEREEASFLGDWPFFRRWRNSPARRAADRRPPGPVRHDGEAAIREAWIASPLRLTEAGRAVLSGERDRLADRPPDRWLGGTRLRPGNVWRWDRVGRSLSRD